eukprot:5109694-Prymnesium_polylepis.1
MSASIPPTSSSAGPRLSGSNERSRRYPKSNVALAALTGRAGEANATNPAALTGARGANFSASDVAAMQRSAAVRQGGAEAQPWPGRRGAAIMPVDVFHGK